MHPVKRKEVLMAERRSLTKRQQAIYDFIREKILNRGYGPTVREIGEAFSIKSPNGVMCHLKALERKGLISREGRRSRAIQLTDQPQLKRTSLPLAGQIAAGGPVLAVEDMERVDFESLLDDEDHFCLKVRGDSMIEDHIADGDFAVIRRQPTARDGEIVAALVDSSDATLKRFYKERGRFRLQPANSRMNPIYSTDVQILGVLVGVIREY
jgi:repressor LexA